MNEKQKEDGFPTVSYEAWREAVEQDPKNAPLEEKLSAKLDDGVVALPLYTEAMWAAGSEGQPGATPWIRGAHPAPPAGGWDVRQIIDLPDVEEAAAQARRDWEGGASSLLIEVGPKGAPLHSAQALGRILEGLPLQECGIALEAGEDFASAAGLLEGVWEARGVAKEAKGAFGADPIGALAQEGRLSRRIDEALGALGDLAQRTHERFPQVTSVSVSTAPYHEAGATAGQELGVALSTGVAYLRALVEKGLSVDEASGQIVLRLQVGADVFWEMAKVRALRWLWGRVLEASGAEAPKVQVEAATSARMMSPRDPWVNLLRTTTAAFAAGSAGAQSLTVLPFDAPLGVPNDFGRRLAKNIQRLLIDETQLHHVVDPGGGSQYLEQLTSQLGEKGWERFQALEGQGGIVAALQAGTLQREIAAEADRREALVAKRALPLTGVSAFPNLKEEVPARPPVAAVPQKGEAAVSIPPLAPRRIGAPFEALRDAADGHRARTGTWPQAFLANLGPVAAHTARSTWTLNLLAAGGIEALSNKGFADGPAAGEGLRQSGAPLAVICGDDETYASLLPAVAKELKAAGAAQVWVAGRPGEREQAWRDAGVDGFLYQGQDAAAALRSLLAVCGVALEEA